MKDLPRVGPFELVAPLGAGAMGEVWRAEHPDGAVALKLLTAEGAREPRFRRALENEIHAVAGLTHPHIVRILDHGVVSEEAAEQSGGRLPATAPYVALELADGPVLRTQGRTWDEVRELLQQVLAALAHAHARGIVHRDLKPDNVLRLGRVYKLADFGIARPLGAERPTAASSGTLGYMAPEQLRGDWRDQGPPTDLYALGCLGWELVVGRQPFRGEGVTLAREQLHAPIPRLPDATHAQVPEGYEGWLHRLLQKDPADRFAAAADALHALAALPPAPSSPAAPASPASPQSPSTRSTLGGLPSDSNLTWLEPLESPAPAPVPDESASLAPRIPAPFPTEWRPREPFEPLRLRGLGLRLFGLRALPVAGREGERDTLWRALGEVHATGSPRAVLLSGHPGEGKSTLARWICERAAELGAAVPIWATWGPSPAPTDGLGPALARHHGCVGLDPDATRARMRRRLPHAERATLGALASLLSGEGHRAASSEREALIRWVLRQEDRPVVLALDDVQWDPQALALARSLLEVGDAPVLVVLTLRDDLLPELGDATAEVERLAAHPHAQRLRPGPLPVADRQRLVRDLLGLEEGLAARVEERSGGNPLFAVHAVGDWVRRGLLVPGPDGFTLGGDARAELPDDLYGVVSARLDALLADRDADDRLALEIGAALGEAVTTSEWHAACVESGVAPAGDLPARLREHGLARADRDRDGWSFAHGLLREALRRDATAADRWQGHHAAIARALCDAEPGRRGLHLVEAGAHAEAIGPLLEGVRNRRAEVRSGLALLTRWEEAMRAAGVGDDDPRWAEGLSLRAHLVRMSGASEDGRRWAERAVERAQRCGHRAAEAEALLELWRSHRDRIRSAEALGALERARELAGEASPRLRARVSAALASALALHSSVDEALEVLRQALDELPDVEADAELVDLYGMTGVMHGLRGEHDVMRHWTERSLALAERLGLASEVALCHQRLASAALQAGDNAGAAEHAGGARRIYEALSQLQHVAQCELTLAEAARYTGDFDEAEALLHRVLAQYRAAGRNPAAPTLSLGLVQLGLGRLAEGRAAIEEVRDRLRADGRTGWVGACQAFLLAGLVDAAEWDAHLDEARRVLGETGLVQRDVLWALELAVERALDAGRAERARAALDLAEGQATALDDDDAAERIEASRARLAQLVSRTPQ